MIINNEVIYYKDGFIEKQESLIDIENRIIQYYCYCGNFNSVFPTDIQAFRFIDNMSDEINEI